MPRVSNSIEDIREIIEGNLACLGNALVLLRLVEERLDLAVRTGRQADLLRPAVEDLRTSKRLIRQVQLGLSGPTKHLMQQHKNS